MPRITGRAADIIADGKILAVLMSGDPRTVDEIKAAVGSGVQVEARLAELDAAGLVRRAERTVVTAVYSIVAENRP